MAKDYSANVPDLEPATLTDRHYAAIGRLVRACAAIEDFVTLFICRMLDLSEGKAHLLLGVTPIRGRLEIARDAADAMERTAKRLMKTGSTTRRLKQYWIAETPWLTAF